MAERNFPLDKKGLQQGGGVSLPKGGLGATGGVPAPLTSGDRRTEGERRRGGGRGRGRSKTSVLILSLFRPHVLLFP